MTFPFDQDRDGAGKNTARRLKDRIGNDLDGTRTVIEKDIVSGETRMLKTKGGMPEITVTKVKKPILGPGNRTFVFKVFGAASSIVANKSGGGMAIVSAPFLTGVASYFVAAWKKVASIKWNDVIRIDNPDATGDSDVILNHAPFTEQATTTVMHSPSGVPYVHRVAGVYASTNPNAATQSMLYVGRMSQAGRGVVNILKTGAVGPTVTINNSGYPALGHSANVRAKPDGTFLFYGGVVSYVTYDNRLHTATTTWSRIKTQVAAPYIVEEAQGAMGVGLMDQNAVELRFPTGYTWTYGYTTYFGPLPDGNPIFYPPAMPGSYSREQVLHWEHNYGQHSATVIEDYAYVGSDIQMRFTSSIDVQNYSNESRYDVSLAVYSRYHYTSTKPPFEQGVMQGQVGNGFLVLEYDAEVKYDLSIPAQLGMKKLTDVVWSRRASTRVWPNECYVAGTTSQGDVIGAVCGMPPNTANRYDITRLDVTTVDYIYADLDEDIFITLEAYIYRFWQWNAPGDWQDVERNDLYGYTAKYVVSVRGVETEFPITFTLPENFGHPWAVSTGIAAEGLPADGGGVMYPDIGYVHLGYKPTPIFNPAFMGQGNCPYIAYTTKAEEAAGVPHEFYLDMEVYLNRLGAYPSNADGARYAGSVNYTPMQFIKAYYQFIQLEFGESIQQNAGVWENYMFPTGRNTYRLQMSNGVKGPWASKIGPEFNGDPHLDISRI